MFAPVLVRIHVHVFVQSLFSRCSTIVPAVVRAVIPVFISVFISAVVPAFVPAFVLVPISLPIPVFVRHRFGLDPQPPLVVLLELLTGLPQED